MHPPKKYKDEKFVSLITKFAGEYLTVESGLNSMITVTRVDVLDRGRRAIIYFTVLPESEEAKAFDFLKRKRRDFRKFVMSKKTFGFAPSFDFEVDLGEHNRQRIDELLNKSVK